MFWPKEIWGRHAKQLEDFKAAGNAAAAVACLNELVTDALRHGPSCLAYMDKLRDPHVFRFCAIPQVMAIGTLAMCYDNHGVFTGGIPSPRLLLCDLLQAASSTFFRSEAASPAWKYAPSL